MKENTFIIPIIDTKRVHRCIETIKKYNKEGTYYIYIVDNTKSGIREALEGKYDLYFRARRNLGYSKSCNTAIRCVQTPYFTIPGDDVEFINSKWWDGVMETFRLLENEKKSEDRPEGASCVVPSSIRHPYWAILKDDKNGKPVPRELNENHDIIPYKEEYTDKEYDFLVNNTHKLHRDFALQPGSIIDSTTFYCPVFNTEKFWKVGMMNEKFYPGTGEDYCWNATSYAKGFRVVGTTLSWIWHWWGKSLNQSDTNYKEVVDMKRWWNNNDELWKPYLAKGEKFDVWLKVGHKVPPITIDEI